MRAFEVVGTSGLEEVVMELSNSLRTFRALTFAYLYGTMTLSEFRAKAAPLALDAGDTRDSKALPIANQILGDFGDLDAGYLAEKDFRQNLTNVLFGQSTVQYIEFQFAPFSSTHGASTGTSTLVGTGSFELVGKGLALEFA